MLMMITMMKIKKIVVTMVVVLMMIMISVIDPNLLEKPKVMKNTNQESETIIQLSIRPSIHPSIHPSTDPSIPSLVWKHLPKRFIPSSPSPSVFRSIFLSSSCKRLRLTMTAVSRSLCSFGMCVCTSV